MIREKISSKQLSRMEKTDGEFMTMADISDPEFSHTAEFEACDIPWRIVFYGTEFATVGFNLHNLSNESLRTRYHIVVKNQTATGDSHVWSDPDGVLTFTPEGTVDDTWGSEEIISFKLLKTVTGLCVKNIVKFIVRISIFNTTDELNEKRRNDLRIPPDPKLSNLERQGSYRREFQQQDVLISNRLSSKSSGHYGASEDKPFHHGDEDEFDDYH